MRDALLGLLLAMAILIAAASPVYAGGDKVRGDGGQGTVHQVQVEDPPPFQPYVASDRHSYLGSVVAL